MFPIGNVNDFKIYRARPEDIETGTTKVLRASEANRRFLEDGKERVSDLQITGSFIYAHPPDYRGRPMLLATVRDWREVFSCFRDMKMDTVIFQAAVWKELEECYYGSRHFGALKTWDVIGPMLDAAQLENMKVYLGGYGSITGWKRNVEMAELEDEIKTHLICYNELLEFKDKFHGFYFPCETAFRGARDLTHEKHMNLLYRKICSELKNAAPDKTLLASPGTKYFPDMEKDFLDSWLYMLDDVSLDILAPQDSIGTCGSSLEDQKKTYPRWRQICRELDIKLWSNIEIFERVSFSSDDNFRPAQKARIAAQLENAADYVSKAICWEALYFM